MAIIKEKKYEININIFDIVINKFYDQQKLCLVLYF